MIAKVLTIAGSDSSGGAGMQGDLKTFSALGVYGASVVTAVTAQNTRGVRAVHDVPAELIAAQLQAVLEDIHIDAVKIGMLHQADAVDAVAEILARCRDLPIVLDPVMRAKDGHCLLQGEAHRRLIERLLPMATVLTPNLPEAAGLLGVPVPACESEMHGLGRGLLELGPRWVLLKGGHLPGPASVDWLHGSGTRRQFSAPRLHTRNTHGTGCTLSSAIAAYLGMRYDVIAAVQQAKHYLNAALRAADALAVGEGQGPLHHFYACWQHNQADAAASVEPGEISRRHDFARLGAE